MEEVAGGHIIFAGFGRRTCKDAGYVWVGRAIFGFRLMYAIVVEILFVTFGGWSWFVFRSYVHRLGVILQTH